MLIAALALWVSIRTSRREQRRADESAERERRAEARIAQIEQREAAQFEIVLLGGRSFEGSWLLGIAVNGTVTIGGLRIDPASILDIGVGGATFWMTAEPGDVLRHFWFRGSEEDWPETIRLTFDRPFGGSRIVRVPRPGVRLSD